MVYLVSYDLIAPGQKYEAVHKVIKSLGNWAKPLESTWFIETDLGLTAVFDKIHAVMDFNDDLLVIEVTLNYKGRFSTDVHDWLKSALSS